MYYFALKTTEKSQRPRLLKEVSCHVTALTSVLNSNLHMLTRKNPSLNLREPIWPQHVSLPMQVKALHVLAHENIVKFFMW